MAQSTDSKRAGAQARPWKLRLGLRLAVAGFCLLAIVMAAILAAQNSILVMGILGPVTVTVFIWSVVDSLSLIFRSQHKGINAGICLGLDVFLSLGLIASVVCTGWFQDWWSGDELATTFLLPATRNKLTEAAIGLASVGTLCEIALCVVALRSLKSQTTAELAIEDKLSHEDV